MELPARFGRIIRWAAALVLGSGCASATYQAAYTRELKRQFEEAELPVSLEAMKERLTRQTQTFVERYTRPVGGMSEVCNPCLEQAECDDVHCLYWVIDTRGDDPRSNGVRLPVDASPRSDRLFVDFISIDSGHTRVRFDCGTGNETCVRALWTLIDGTQLDQAEAKAKDVATRETLVAEEDFSPTLTLAATGFIAIGSAETGLGARAGFRRWATMNVITTLIFEYEHAYLATPPAPIANPSDVHIMSLEVRIELSQWTRWVEANFALPEASIFLAGAPVFAVSADPIVGNGYGWRAAVGGQLSNYTGTVALPVTLEVGAEQIFFRRFQALGVRFTVGFGI
jgi:hypothetical protein